MVSIDEEQPLKYNSVHWINGSRRVLLVHRLAVNPNYQGQGIGKRIMDFVEDYAERKGYGFIRLDAYSGNPRALRLYETRGYQKAGQVYYPERDLPFYCYEKVLKEG